MIIKSLLLFFPLLIGQHSLSQVITGKVISVKDGDTIEILSGDSTIKIRLKSIDCPEKTQDFGQAAKKFTSEKCFGKIVEAHGHKYDRYGRLLAEIFLKDRESLNSLLVKYGMAWHYKRYSNDKKLSDLELLARAKKNGLWSLPNPIPPWDYRHSKLN